MGDLQEVVTYFGKAQNHKGRGIDGVIFCAQIQPFWPSIGLQKITDRKKVHSRIFRVNYAAHKTISERPRNHKRRRIDGAIFRARIQPYYVAHSTISERPRNPKGRGIDGAIFRAQIQPNYVAYSTISERPKNHKGRSIEGEMFRTHFGKAQNHKGRGIDGVIFCAQIQPFWPSIGLQKITDRKKVHSRIFRQRKKKWKIKSNSINYSYSEVSLNAGVFSEINSGQQHIIA
ncbi:hypothetical protein YC2023_051308 [Brassica napus]